MTEPFITVPIETDAQTLADNAVEHLRSTWDGWEPNDGDLEVIQIETLAPMAADAAETAATVFPTIFRAYGTDLIGIPYEAGSAASTTVTFNLTDTGPHTIPAGAEIDIDGYAFAVDAATPATIAIAGVPVTATEPGAAQNALVGGTVTLITALAFVASVTADHPTGGGADPEDDTAYQNRLAAELQLQAKTLVTTRDFEIEALSDPGVGRAVAVADSARHVTVTVTDDNGEIVAPAVKTRLTTVYANYRQVNTIVAMTDATYTTVGVVYVATAYPGYALIDLEDRINAMLADFLSPTVWGTPLGFGDPGTGVWYNEPVVRRNKLIDVIGNVEGVNYVTTVTITGSAGTVDGSGNLTMPGTIPLPRPGVIDGILS